MHPGGAGPQQTPFKRLNGQIRPLLEEVGDANPCDGVVPRKIGNKEPVESFPNVRKQYENLVEAHFELLSFTLNLTNAMNQYSNIHLTQEEKQSLDGLIESLQANKVLQDDVITDMEKINAYVRRLQGKRKRGREEGHRGSGSGI
uniref:Uncharacterized protein n=2 Tax=Meloidogyne TaxID=189290 RepID=A0A6V7V8I7_MELEN|nr:unnamed protein product [Meloidogyne enterolobii]